MQNNDTYQVINTKVSIPAYRRLVALMRKKGLNWYQTIQMYVDITLRYMDGWHNLSEEMERMMYVFEKMIGWDKALTLSDPSTKRVIGEATYYLYDADGNKKGCRAVHVKKPFFGQWQETFNVAEILEQTICMLVPTRYSKLRTLLVELKRANILDLLDYFIDYYSHHADLQAIRDEFEDANRHEFGMKPHDGEPFRRHHHKSVNDIDDQPTINFSEADAEMEDESTY